MMLFSPLTIADKERMRSLNLSVLEKVPSKPASSTTGNENILAPGTKNFRFSSHRKISFCVGTTITAVLYFARRDAAARDF